MPRASSRSAPLAALAPALTLPAASAGAQVTFTDRATFLAALSSPLPCPLEPTSAPVAPASVAILGDVGGNVAHVTTVGGDPFGALQLYPGAGNQALGGSSGGAVDNFLPLLFTFDRPFTAFGFDDLDLTFFGGAPTEFAIIDVTWQGRGFQRYSVSTTAPLDPVFFGIITPTPLVSVQVFSADDVVNPAPDTRANLVDNLIVGDAVATPEPGLITLVATGLVALGALRRRRR